MSKLFKDALDDAKKLREIAEQNATNKIIEAVAPRIKALIESELVDDDEEFSGDDVPEEIEFFDDGADSSSDDAGIELDLPEAAPDDLVSDAGAALPSEPAPIDLGGMMDTAEQTTTPTEFSFEKDGKQVKVAVTVESNKRRKVVDIKKMSVSQLLRALNETKSNKVRKAIINEISKIRRRLIIMSEAGDKNSQTKLNALNLLLKENKNMRRKNASRTLSESAWWLLKEEDEEGAEGAEETELDLGDDEEGGDEAADVDVDAASSALEDLGAALGLDVEVEAEEAEAGDDDDDDEGDDDDEFDLDLGEADHDEMKYEADEADHDEAYHEADHDDLDEADEDEVMEIFEAMLRREIARMTGAARRTPSRRARRSNARLAESRRRRMQRRRRLAEMGDPLAAMHGGAEEVIEVSEQDLINALAEELGDSAGAELSVDGSGVAADGAADQFGGGSAEGEALAESRRARRQLRNAKKQLVEAKREAAAAKQELKESNLFNAKLLYVNKLMQSYDLNVKQQRAIVEALDNAKTLREAKLLYTSLTDSLKKGRSAKGGTMNESVSRTGSASKSVRSSAPANNGTELGRWAVLAGLNNK